MGLMSQAGTLTSLSTTGNQTVTLDNSIWGGASPKAIMFFWGAATVDGTADDNHSGFGVAISSSSRAAIHTFSNDDAITSMSYRRHDNTKCITLHSGGGAIQDADFVSFGADEFTIDWVTSTVAREYHFLALGGDDLENVYLDEITSPSSTGTQSYSGVGFSPDALIAFSVLDASAPPTTTANGLFSIGMSDGSTSSHNSVAIRDSVATTVSHHYCKEGTFISDVYNGAVREEASVQSLDSDGYTLDWTDAVAGNAYIWVLCLKGTQIKILNSDQPSSNSTVNRSVGFGPMCSLFITCSSVYSENVMGNAMLGIGAWDSSDNMSCVEAFDQHNQSTSNSGRVFDSNESIKHIDVLKAAVGSMSPSANGNSLDEVWTDCDGTQRRHGIIIFGMSGAGDTSEDIQEANSGNYSAQNGIITVKANKNTKIQQNPPNGVQTYGLSNFDTEKAKLKDRVDDPRQY